MTRARIFCAFFIAMLAVGLIGCGDSPKAPSGGGNNSAPSKATVHKAPAGAPLKLAFITNNASDFWNIAKKGVEKFEKEKNVKVDFKLPPTGKVEEQLKIMEDLVSQGYHGFAVSVIAPKDEIREINKACEKLNVICHDSDAPASKRLCYIGTNNFAMGKALGEELKKLLPDGGKIAVFVGTFSADNAHQRLAGIEDAIKGTKIVVVQKKEDNKDPVKARSNVEDVINTVPDVAALVGLWSYNTPMIVAAVKASSKVGKIKIAGCDEEDGTLLGIEDGSVSYTVVQKPFEFGYQSSLLLHKLATEGEAALPKDPIIDTGIEIIMKDTVTAFKTKLAELRK